MVFIKEDYFNVRVTRDDTPLNKKLVEYLYSLPKSQRGRTIRKIMNVGWKVIEKDPGEMYKAEMEQLGIITGKEKDIDINIQDIDLDIEGGLEEIEEEISEEDIKSKFKDLESEEE